jgi:hypothetical protein
VGRGRGIPEICLGWVSQHTGPEQAGK